MAGRRARQVFISLMALVAMASLVLPGPRASAATGGDVVDIDYAAPPGGSPGVYITHSDGRIEARDGLPTFGDQPALTPGEKVIALSVRPNVDGYWLFTDQGRAFAFGAAAFHGDAGNLTLAAPMISAIATPDGQGYYMVAEDGGIFTYGSATFHGSVPEVLPGVTLDAPVIGIAPSPTGGGYLLVAADGGIFTFGDAVFYGSVPGVLPGVTLDEPVVGVIPQPAGYLMVASDGGIFNFGTAQFHGSLGGTGTTGIVGVAVVPDNSGYLMIDSTGATFPFGSTDTLGQVVYSGSGNRTIAIDKPASGANLVRFEIDDMGIGVVRVTQQDSGSNYLDELLNNNILTDSPTGTVLLEFRQMLGIADPPTAFLDVTADSGTSWKLGLLPLNHARTVDRGQSFSGSGPDVFYIENSTTASTITLKLDVLNQAEVWWFPDGGASSLVITQTGPSTMQGSISGDHGLLYLNTDATNWTVTIG